MTNIIELLNIINIFAVVAWIIIATIIAYYLLSGLGLFSSERDKTNKRANRHH